MVKSSQVAIEGKKYTRCTYNAGIGRFVGPQKNPRLYESSFTQTAPVQQQLATMEGCVSLLIQTKFLIFAPKCRECNEILNMNKDDSTSYAEKVFFRCSSRRCNVKVCIRNFLKIPLSKNSLNTKGVMHFLFNCYPVASMCVGNARKWLIQEFNSNFDNTNMIEVFKHMRHSIAAEMLKRNNETIISGPCLLAVSHWSPSPP
jgi:hypothetical protein